MANEIACLQVVNKVKSVTRISPHYCIYPPAERATSHHRRFVGSDEGCDRCDKCDRATGVKLGTGSTPQPGSGTAGTAAGRNLPCGFGTTVAGRRGGRGGQAKKGWSNCKEAEANRESELD